MENGRDARKMLNEFPILNSGQEWIATSFQ